MINKVRCKFKCVGVDKPEDFEQENIRLEAVTDTELGPDGENSDNEFAKYTPSGEFVMAITNPKCHGFFEVGKKYFIDISPVPGE